MPGVPKPRRFLTCSGNPPAEECWHLRRLIATDAIRAKQRDEAVVASVAASAPPPASGGKGSKKKRPREGSEAPSAKDVQPAQKQWPTPTVERYKDVSNEDLDEQIRRVARARNKHLSKAESLDRRGEALGLIWASRQISSWRNKDNEMDSSTPGFALVPSVSPSASLPAVSSDEKKAKSQ